MNPYLCVKLKQVDQVVVPNISAYLGANTSLQPNYAGRIELVANRLKARSRLTMPGQGILLERKVRNIT